MQSDDGTWTVELAPGRFFSDGTPVTAEAVAAALNRTGEAKPLCTGDFRAPELHRRR